MVALCKSSVLLFVTILTTFIVQSLSDCTSSLLLDIVFVVDSSGSVGQKHFNEQLKFAQSVVMDDALPTNIRFSFINFSDKIETEFNLSHYGNPNNLQAVYHAIDDIKYLGGYTWTNSAMKQALKQFNDDSNSKREKALILLTDGAPKPAEEQKVCDSNTGFVSNELNELRNMGVHIITIGIDFDHNAFHRYVECLADGCITGRCQVYNANDFNDGLHDLINNITTVICSDPTSAPTDSPTSSPINVPTPSPTNIPTASRTNAPTPFPTNVPTIYPTKNEETQIVVNVGLDLVFIWVLLIFAILFVICCAFGLLYYLKIKKVHNEEFMDDVKREHYESNDYMSDIEITPNNNSLIKDNMGNKTVTYMIDLIKNKKKEYKFYSYGAVDIMIKDEFEEK